MKLAFKITFLLCWFLGTAQAQTYNQWVKKADFGGLQRARAVGFSVGNTGYALGGVDTADQVHNDLWAYDPGTNTWSQRASLPGSVRRNAVATVLDDIAYVGTGVDSVSAQTGTILKDWWAYSAISNSWIQKADYPGGGGNGVYFATAFTQNGYAYVCGGKIAPATYTPELWAYDPGLDHWYRFSDFPGGDRHKLASIAVGDTAYVGLGTDDDIYRSDWWAYHAFLDVWESRTDFPGGDRASVSTFSVLGRGFVCLGENGGFQKDLWEYDPRYDVWTNRANFGGQERRYAISFSIGDKGYVGTGQGSSGKKRSFYEYNPAYLSSREIEALKGRFYPNPCKQHGVISLERSGVFDVEIRSLNGKLVLQETIEGNRLNLNFESIEAGTYMLKVRGEGSQMAKQIVVL